MSVASQFCAPVLSLALMGCQDRLPDVVWSGAHVEVATDANLDATCAGTLPYLDEVAGQVRERLGTADESPIRYFWLPGGTTGYRDGGCPEDFLGCGAEGKVYTRQLPHEHELVHAARQPKSLSYPVLEEGLAEYWGDDYESDYGPRVPLREMLAHADNETYLPLADYPTAAHFVSYLIARFGIDTVLDLFGDIGFFGLSTNLDAAMLSRLGVGLGEVTGEYEATPWCTRMISRDMSILCEIAEPVSCASGAGDVLEFEAVLDCDDDRVVGPRRGEIVRAVSFEVAVRGTYRIEVGFVGEIPYTYESFGSVQLEQCGSGCGRRERTVALKEQRPMLELWLEPGRYRLRFSLNDRADTLRGYHVRIGGADDGTTGTLCAAN